MSWVPSFASDSSSVEMRWELPSVVARFTNNVLLPRSVLQVKQSPSKTARRSRPSRPAAPSRDLGPRRGDSEPEPPGSRLGPGPSVFGGGQGGLPLPAAPCAHSLSPRAGRAGPPPLQPEPGPAARRRRLPLAAGTPSTAPRRADSDVTEGPRCPPSIRSSRCDDHGPCQPMMLALGGSIE
jgi:hypothetical protein